MNVHDLSPKKLDELRNSEAWKEMPDGTINTECVEDITDEMLFERYEGIDFVPDDFWCNQPDYIVEV